MSKRRRKRSKEYLEWAKLLKYYAARLKKERAKAGRLTARSSINRLLVSCLVEYGWVQKWLDLKQRHAWDKWYQSYGDHESGHPEVMEGEDY